MTKASKEQNKKKQGKSSKGKNSLLAVLAVALLGFIGNGIGIGFGNGSGFGEEADGMVVVEVTDDNASLRAYTDLLDKLEERNIDYIEK